jgi:hypothetical protein
MGYDEAVSIHNAMGKPIDTTIDVDWVIPWHGYKVNQEIPFVSNDVSMEIVYDWIKQGNEFDGIHKPLDIHSLNKNCNAVRTLHCFASIKKIPEFTFDSNIDGRLAFFKTGMLMGLNCHKLDFTLNRSTNVMVALSRNMNFDYIILKGKYFQSAADMKMMLDNLKIAMVIVSDTISDNLRQD